MVKRAADTPVGLVEVLRAERKAREDVARAGGHGTTALRDAAGNAMVMEPSAPYPLLRPVGIDAALAFDGDGVLRAVSPDTQESRDFAMRKLLADQGGSFGGDVDVTGHMGVVGLLEADTMGTKTLGVGTVNAARVNTGTTWMAGGVLRLDGGNLVTDFNNGASGGTVYTLKVECGDVVYNNLVKRSDPDLKERRRKISRSPGAAIADTAWDIWSYRRDAERVGDPYQQATPAALDPAPEVVPPPSGPTAWVSATSGLLVPEAAATAALADDPPMPEAMPVDPHRDQVGPMADELDRNPLLSLCVIHDEDGKAVGVDYASLVGIVGAAVAEHHTRLVAQARTIAGLREQQKTDRSRLDDLERQNADLAARLDRLDARLGDGGSPSTTKA